MNITSIPVLTDNYIHVMDSNKGTALVVDPAEAAPILDFLNQKKLILTDIFLTHHHGDHIDGVQDLVKQYPKCRVYGFSKDQHRLPTLTNPVEEGSKISFESASFEVWELPGHTLGHIGYISKGQQIAFTGDVLFGMGCGRLFEGSFEQMYTSLNRIKSLSDETKIYCTHEYTAFNGHFAEQVLPENKEIKKRQEETIKLRRLNKYTVPLRLATELETNPFLLAKSLEQFTDYRQKRNSFQIP